MFSRSHPLIPGARPTIRPSREAQPVVHVARQVLQEAPEAEHRLAPLARVRPGVEDRLPRGARALGPPPLDAPPLRGERPAACVLLLVVERAHEAPPEGVHLLRRAPAEERRHRPQGEAVAARPVQHLAGGKTPPPPRDGQPLRRLTEVAESTRLPCAARRAVAEPPFPRLQDGALDGPVLREPAASSPAGVRAAGRRRARGSGGEAAGARDIRAEGDGRAVRLASTELVAFTRAGCGMTSGRHRPPGVAGRAAGRMEGYFCSWACGNDSRRRDWTQ